MDHCSRILDWLKLTIIACVVTLSGVEGWCQPTEVTGSTVHQSNATKLVGFQAINDTSEGKAGFMLIVGTDTAWLYIDSTGNWTAIPSLGGGGGDEPWVIVDDSTIRTNNPAGDTFFVQTPTTGGALLGSTGGGMYIISPLGVFGNAGGGDYFLQIGADGSPHFKMQGNSSEFTLQDSFKVDFAGGAMLLKGNNAYLLTDSIILGTPNYTVTLYKDRAAITGTQGNPKTIQMDSLSVSMTIERGDTTWQIGGFDLGEMSVEFSFYDSTGDLAQLQLVNTGIRWNANGDNLLSMPQAASGRIVFKENPGSGTDGTTVGASEILTGNTSFFFPASNGSTGDVLVNTGSGQTAWRSKGSASVYKLSTDLSPGSGGSDSLTVEVGSLFHYGSAPPCGGNSYCSKIEGSVIITNNVSDTLRILLVDSTGDAIGRDIPISDFNTLIETKVFPYYDGTPLIDMWIFINGAFAGDISNIGFGTYDPAIPFDIVYEGKPGSNITINGENHELIKYSNY